MFLSLDSGDADKKEDLQSRTIEAMRIGNLRFTLQEMPKQKHWYKTHQFAWVIFDEINKISNYRFDVGSTDAKLFFNTKADIDTIKPYFAHTNSAKCCMNNKHAEQASRILFENCREYIPEEIKIFDPHILVTQGNYARTAIEDAIKKKFFSMKKEKNLSMANRKKPNLRIVEITLNRSALWIHHYHPSNYGVFNTKVYPKYREHAKNAARFIADNYQELFQLKFH